MKNQIPLILAVGALLAWPAVGEPPAGAPAEPAPRLIERLTEVLSLSDSQTASVETLVESHRNQVRALREEQRADREAIRALVEGENPDPAEVGRLVIATHAKRQQVKAARESFEASLSALLTPEQRTAFDAVKRDRSFGPAEGGRFGARRRHQGHPPVSE